MRRCVANSLGDGNFAMASHHDQTAVPSFNGVNPVQTQDAFVTCLEHGLLRATACSAADMERAHGELGPRLADRLRGDDSDRFAQIHPMAAAEIAPVALAANPT